MPYIVLVIYLVLSMALQLLLGNFPVYLISIYIVPINNTIEIIKSIKPISPITYNVGDNIDDINGI